MNNAGIAEALKGCRLPAWELIPDFGLYMDQVLTYVDRNLPGLRGFQGLTAAMINNYVKARLMDKPVGKKYPRDSVAQLMMICLLKQSLPQEMIRQLLRSDASRSTEAVYNDFRKAQQSSMALVLTRMESLSPEDPSPGLFALAQESAFLSLVTRLRLQPDEAGD